MIWKGDTIVISNLREMMENYQKHAIAAFNVFGYEDASAVIRAAEKCGTPVILMINRAAADYIPLEIIGPMLDEMGRAASVPVGVHLDHAVTLEAIRVACEYRFTSVMFDGSQLALEDNITNTLKAIAIAAPKGIPVEGEIGSVGYNDSKASIQGSLTDPQEAKLYYNATKVDCLAVSIGTVHRLTTRKVDIHFELLDKIRSVVPAPLVIHGATSIKDEDLITLSRVGIRKINLGTCLRLAFGNSLRQSIQDNPDLFDRLQLFRIPIWETEVEASRKIRLITPSCDIQAV